MLAPSFAEQLKVGASALGGGDVIIPVLLCYRGRRTADRWLVPPSIGRQRMVELSRFILPLNRSVFQPIGHLPGRHA